mgnify:CR=1 FL=1
MAEPAAARPPSVAYDAGVASGRWQDDPAQRPALAQLDRIHAGLLARESAPAWKRWLGRGGEPVPGLYLWGGVGRGKTFLNDLLFDQLGELPRRRWHFHRFMVEVNARVQALPADTADTVAVVADGLAEFAAPGLRVLPAGRLLLRHLGMAFDAYLPQIAAEIDTTKRNKLIEEAVALEREDVSHVPLHQQPITWAARKGVQLSQGPDNQMRLWLVRVPAK